MIARNSDQVTNLTVKRGHHQIIGQSNEDIIKLKGSHKRTSSNQRTVKQGHHQTNRVIRGHHQIKGQSKKDIIK